MTATVEYMHCTNLFATSEGTNYPPNKRNPSQSFFYFPLNASSISSPVSYPSPEQQTLVSIQPLVFSTTSMPLARHVPVVGLCLWLHHFFLNPRHCKLTTICSQLLLIGQCLLHGTLQLWVSGNSIFKPLQFVTVSFFASIFCSIKRISPYGIGIGGGGNKV